MNIFSGTGRFMLFLGDILFLYAALVVSLFIRYPQEFGPEVLQDHLAPFSVLFVAWVVVFIIAGLYEKHVRVLKNRLPSTILRVQVVNSILAVIFFYAIPVFGITPKTTLFVFLVVSFVFIVLWRMYGPLLLGQKAQSALFIGSGEEFHELAEELLRHKGYPLSVARIIDLGKTQPEELAHELSAAIQKHPETTVIALDIEDARLEKAMPLFYELIAAQYTYVDIHRLYEDVFKRLPVSLLDERWFIQNVSFLPSRMYDALKRLADIIVATICFVASLPFYVLAYALIKIDDRGPVFFAHERVGQNNKPITIVKFRTMPVHSEKDGLSKGRIITPVGSFLRRSRIDELPQLMNVIRGDLSLIGPRPELPALVAVYEKQVPYYGLRHLVKPGLSGWAQINQNIPPKFAAEVAATKIKVSYDLFYIKHRSFLLDVLIALQTVRELLSRKGI